MKWQLPDNREIDSYGEDIDIYAVGMERLCKLPGFRNRLPRKHYLKLVVDNTQESIDSDHNHKETTTRGKRRFPKSMGKNSR